MTADQRLRPSERLRLKRDYARVFAEGGSAGDGLLVVYALKNDLAWSRLGMSVGRRVGSAVRRSLVRRRIREAFRRHKAQLPVGCDVVCVARAAAAKPGVDLADALIRLAAKAAKRSTESAGRPRSRSPEP